LSLILVAANLLHDGFPFLLYTGRRSRRKIHTIQALKGKIPIFFHLVWINSTGKRLQVCPQRH
jgi:hypothetical protein